MRELAAFISTLSVTGDNYVSDVPWDVAFYGGRTAIWLPPTLAEIEAHNARYIRKVDYILLSPYVNAPAIRYEQFWRDLYRQAPAACGEFRLLADTVVQGRRYVVYQRTPGPTAATGEGARN